MKTPIIWSSYKNIIQVLDKKEKRQWYKMFFLLLLNSVLELIGLAALLPLFQLVLEKDYLQNTAFLRNVFHFLGFKDPHWFTVALCFGILVLFIFKNLSSLWIVKYQNQFALNLGKNLGLQLLQNYYQKGLLYFKGKDSNKLVFNIHYGMTRFAQGEVLGLLNLITELVIVSVIVSAIIIFNPIILILLAISVVPVFIYLFLKVKKMSASMGNKAQKHTPLVQKVLYDSIFGFIDVRLSNTFPYFKSKAAHHIEEITKINVQRNVLNLVPTKIIEITLVLSVSIIISVGIFYYSDRGSLITLLGLFTIAGYRILPSVNRSMIAFMGIQENFFTFDILKDLENDQSLKENEIILFEHRLNINHLSFKYPDGQETVLEDINMEIKKGETIGIIGSSGSGKTTLMNIMLGFITPVEGEITIDGRPLKPKGLNSYLNHVGYVQQDIFLTNSSIAENIAFGIPKELINYQKVMDACKKASLWELVQGLEEGLETPIGEKGTMLSGGQRQRIGIARALYRDAKILFFDEATSALDLKTEQEITNSIQNLQKENITMVIIAHRIATLSNTDRIYEMEKGRIKQITSYNKLSLKGPLGA